MQRELICLKANSHYTDRSRTSWNHNVSSMKFGRTKINVTTRPAVRQNMMLVVKIMAKIWVSGRCKWGTQRWKYRTPVYQSQVQEQNSWSPVEGWGFVGRSRWSHHPGSPPSMCWRGCNGDGGNTTSRWVSQHQFLHPQLPNLSSAHLLENHRPLWMRWETRWHLRTCQ